MSAYSISLFIFRRDLRLHDNTALNEALRLSDQVIPCFIFDPVQIDSHPYQSKPGLQFMLESFSDLQQQFIDIGSQLALYHASPEQIIKRLHEQHQSQAVFINRDYTPFSRHRDI
jgi:deoxyribodipyrimidine photo-lyase